MPQYRTNEAITYVHEGKVLHIGPHKNVELDEDQAEKLGDKVSLVETPAGLMFPKGNPVIDVLRLDPHHDGANKEASKADVKVEPAKGKK